MSEAATKRVENLIQLTESLTALISAECRAFEARRPQDAARTLEETSRLANLYRHESIKIRADRSLIEGAPLRLRTNLIRATEAFDSVLARHGRALEAAKVVTEGIVRAVADEVVKRRSTGAGYGSGGTAVAAPGTAITLKIEGHSRALAWLPGDAMLIFMLSRYATLHFVLAGAIICALLGTFVTPAWDFGLLVFLPLAAIGVYDLVQKRHAILRNYPLIGRLRFILEHIRPEIRQYLIEDERDPVPFSREQRELVYRRAKGAPDVHPFGTVANVYGDGYGWIDHSMQPLAVRDHDFRVTIGGPDCKQPYEASILNISGTSFGAVSANAIQAMNWGAKLGGFAHNTGEGSISPHHRKYGGDIIWQIATGYFGCRTPEGRFDPDCFAQQAADPQVKMIEIKLSQGAKPGHGGILPKEKITPEIAATRHVLMGRDCISPASHPEFTTPLEYCAFVKRLRDLSGGKPIGTKLAIGHRHEFLALVKATLETGIAPDFIVIDGGEGGTGAAPMELSDHVGAPLVEALSFVRNALNGAGLREKIKLGASGKVISAYDMVRVFALGADFVMVARGFMFAVGCIQSRTCHNNKCPTGVATQDPSRQSALVVTDKAPRVASFHRSTLRALGEVLGAAGVRHPEDLMPWHLHVRHASGRVIRGDEAYPPVDEGSLLTGKARAELLTEWKRAQTTTFAPKRA